MGIGVGGDWVDRDGDRGWEGMGVDKDGDRGWEGMGGQGWG